MFLNQVYVVKWMVTDLKLCMKWKVKFQKTEILIERTLIQILNTNLLQFFNISLYIWEILP